MRAYEAGIQLAHHVDIGVAHVRNTLDLSWLDRLIAQLGGTAIPRAMHVEAIVWAALAMHVGGGYLNPRALALLAQCAVEARGLEVRRSR